VVELFDPSLNNRREGTESGDGAFPQATGIYAQSHQSDETGLSQAEMEHKHDCGKKKKRKEKKQMEKKEIKRKENRWRRRRRRKEKRRRR